MSAPLPPVSHPWRFFRAGGFDQVLLENGRDLLALSELDQKLWVALSCPVEGVEFDRRTLELLDSDHDGQIRVPELLAAISWTAARLTDAELLVTGSDSLPLAAIAATPDGERLRATAAAILTRLGKDGAEAISVADTADSDQLFSAQRCNGDGIVPPNASDDPTVQEWLSTVVACCGAVADRSGNDGIDLERLEKFDAAVATRRDWLAAGAALLPEGLNDAERSVRLWLEVKDKLADFFLRCRLAAYDPRAQNALNAAEEGLLALAPQNLASAGDAVAALPLAQVHPGQVLNLGHGLNPSWSAAIERFAAELVAPLRGPGQTLDAADWEALQRRLAPLEAWWQTQAESPVAALDAAQLAAWQEQQLATTLRALIDADLAAAAEGEALLDVEKLVRFSRDLYPLANNFVSFRDFYTRRRKAIFQSGTLYLDGRSCELCVAVTDVARHAQLAGLSRLFLAYCECRRPDEPKRMIAAAVTNGDTDQLMVGRNGLFYDRQGRDWQTTVVRLVEHPISLRQSFWAPYRRVGRMVSDQLNKMAAARAKATEDKLAQSTLQAGQKVEEKSAPQQAFDVAKFAGIFAAIGLAVGALGTAVASIATGLLRLAWWQMPLAILGVMLLISGPSMLIDWFKLRQRNLGPLLDANGWAVNARAKLNIPFGAALTGIPRLPKGSRSSLVDPFAERRWPTQLALGAILLGLVVFLLWHYRLLGN